MEKMLMKGIVLCAKKEKKKSASDTQRFHRGLNKQKVVSTTWETSKTGFSWDLQMLF